MKKTLLLIASLVSIPAFAGTPGINQHQANQQRRIDQGVASGQLTGNEAARLQDGQARVANMKTNAKADGVVTGKERAQIRKAQRGESNRIFNKKHN